MLEILNDVVSSNVDVVLFSEDSDNAIFFETIWALILYTLIILILMMRNSIKMTLKLLFMSDLRLGVIVTDNARHVKKI